MFADRIQQTSTSVGAVMTLGSATTNFRAFSSAFATGSNVQYAIRSSDGTEWESGYGRLTGANELTRDFSTGNSASTQPSLITFSAGTKYVTSTPCGRGIAPLFPPAIVTASPKIVSNRFGYADVVSGLTSSTMSDGRVYYMPLLLEQPTRIEGITFSVSTFVGGFNCDGGIYNVQTDDSAGAEGQPGVLLHNATGIAVSGTGFQSMAFASKLQLPPGPYFLAVVMTTPGFNEVVCVDSPPQLSWLGLNPTSLYPYVGCYEASATLPASASLTPTMSTFTGGFPLIMLTSE